MVLEDFDPLKLRDVKLLLCCCSLNSFPVLILFIVPEMIYNVSSGTISRAIPCHLILFCFSNFYSNSFSFNRARHGRMFRCWVVLLAGCVVNWHALRCCCSRCWASTVHLCLVTSQSGRHRRSTLIRHSCRVAVLHRRFSSWARRQAGECCRWSGAYGRPRRSAARWPSAVDSNQSPARRYLPVWKRWDTANDLKA